MIRRDFVYSPIWSHRVSGLNQAIPMSVQDILDPIVAGALANLDLLSPSDIPNLDDSCPICLLTFRAVLEPREDGLQGKAASGVARVGGCGHLFCEEE